MIEKRIFASMTKRTFCDLRTLSLFLKRFILFTVINDNVNKGLKIKVMQ